MARAVSLRELTRELNALIGERERLGRELLKESADKSYQWVHLRRERLI